MSGDQPPCGLVFLNSTMYITHAIMVYSAGDIQVAKRAAADFVTDGLRRNTDIDYSIVKMVFAISDSPTPVSRNRGRDLTAGRIPITRIAAPYKIDHPSMQGFARPSRYTANATLGDLPSPLRAICLYGRIFSSTSNIRDIGYWRDTVRNFTTLQPASIQQY